MFPTPDLGTFRPQFLGTQYDWMFRTAELGTFPSLDLGTQPKPIRLRSQVLRSDLYTIYNSATRPHWNSASHQVTLVLSKSPGHSEEKSLSWANKLLKPPLRDFSQKENTKIPTREFSKIYFQSGRKVWNSVSEGLRPVKAITILPNIFLYFSIVTKILPIFKINLDTKSHQAHKIKEFQIIHYI